MEKDDNEVSLRVVMDCNAEIENRLSNDFKCVICKRILINAHSGPCGCRYCRKCITNYLEVSNKFCPGGSEDCEEQQLCLDRNVLIDQAVIIKISKIIVKCPETACSFKDEIRKMKNHMRLCVSKSDKCPYCHIGCSATSMARDQINEHLQAEHHSHTKLLLEWIDNLNNEMGAMRRHIDAMKSANQSLRDEVSVMHLGMENKEAQIAELQSKNIDNDSRINLLEQRLQTTETRLNLCEKGQKEVQRDQRENAVTITAKKSEPLDCEAISKYGEFHWIIDNFSAQKKDAENGIITELFSGSFFTHENGYKLCLRVDPDGNALRKGLYMSVYFCVMRGPFDDQLWWPMKHHVVLALINQQSGLVHTSQTVCCDQMAVYTEIQRPVVERNNGFGFSKFIKLDELLAAEGLLMNDQLHIRCTIQLEMSID